MNLTSGSRLGPYETVAPLGAGGMGEVFRARDTRLKREVAIKVLPQALSLDPERLRRFEQEALATAALNHPNILAVFDIGTNQGSPYVVSELLEGETLRERLRSGSIAVRKTLDYALQIAHGDGGSLYVASSRADQKIAKVYRVNIATGKMELWRTFGAEAGTGVTQVGAPRFSSDGSAYAYVYSQVLSEAYVVTGLK